MNRKAAILLTAIALAALLATGSWSSLQADTTCPDHQPVTIDIKPGSYPNSIKLGSTGVLPVAILTTDSFDANQFAPEMAMLSDAATMSMDCMESGFIRYTRKDVNGDGKLDLLFFFDTSSLDLTSSSTAATLMAHGTYAGTVLHVMGTDSVQIVP